MIVPSIDLMNGRAVQLEQGRDLRIDAGDPRPIAERFALVGEIAVVDLDAALGRGANDAAIRDLLRIADCRVGGGIRDAETALRWLDLGATKVVLGTAARPEVLSRLPRERVIAALDAREGEVVVEGWTKGAGVRVEERMRELAPYVGGFLVTTVEREGRMVGVDLERARALRDAAGDAKLTFAGGVRDAGEIAALDDMGVDAQIGMALYSGRFTLADALLASLRSDRPDGLIPTVVCDERGVALGLCWSSPESLRLALDERRGVYHSRARGLWRKGETSGAVQELLRVDLDCDRDALRFTVRQRGPGFCHLDTRTCWGEDRGLGALARRLAQPPETLDTNSYTARLLREPGLLEAKIREEADELCRAESADDTTHEAADVLYFALVRLAQRGAALADVERELARRARRVTRRRGDAKPAFTQDTP
ncbi:MAG: phosphoribosyl-ATP diphosphatase [Phycisphaerales bacterium]|nr:MAG: phosphoribosyl-ATP diphosphatase [Phycisphaerales bacterium]